MSEVLILQHNDRCPPGHLITFFQRQQPAIAYRIVPIDKTPEAELPAHDAAWLAIVSLGGPQAAYEDDIYPYLAWEKRFLRAHYERGTPILGICLGCQLLADVIGGKAFKGPRFEVGYPDLVLSETATTDPFVKRLSSGSGSSSGNENNSNDVLSRRYISHHGDTFTLPSDATLLLKSAHYPQMYRCGSILAVQYHPEASANELAVWVSGDSDERLASVNTTRQEVLADSDARRTVATQDSEAFFAAWWDAVVRA